MSDNDFDRTARTWLEDGPTVIPDRALQAALAEIHVTRQRRAWWPARRFISMGHPLRLAALMAAIVLATVVGMTQLLPRNGGVAGPHPGPTRSATPTPRVLPPKGDTDMPALDPGTYVTADPFPIRITITVAAGWRGGIGGPYVVGFDRADGGQVYFSLFDKVYADPCHVNKGLLSPPPGPSVDALATALSNLPGIDATTPTDVTVSGYHGKQVTLTVPIDTTGCTLTSNGDFRVWELPLGATNDLTPGTSDKVWILDVGGQRLVIDAPTYLSPTPQEAAEVHGILDSIRIAPATDNPSPSGGR